MSNEFGVNMPFDFEKLKQIAIDGSATQEELVTVIKQVQSDIDGESIDSVNDAIAGYCDVLKLSHSEHLGLLATVTGGLVEYGGDGDRFANIMLGWLESLIEPARAFHLACEQLMPSDEEMEEKDIDPYEHMGDLMSEKAEAMSDEAAAWATLNQWYGGMVAAFSRSPSARRQARPWVAKLHEFAEYNGGASWLAQLIPVFDDEPIVVIEPGTGVGFEGRIRGISDNFQLHMLLMDVVPNQADERRVSEEFAALARGEAEQQMEGVVVGHWNMYTCNAINPDLSLPDDGQMDSENWIWGEGIPADIPVIRGRRAILLGPAAYERSWSPVRSFQALMADVVIERELSEAEVKEWLIDMVKATGES